MIHSFNVQLFPFLVGNIIIFLNYQVIIEGTRGIGYRGDIAIDDITIQSGACGSKCVYIYYL
jgi:hypothetical protein